MNAHATAPVRLGTRGSDLALWQTRHVADALAAAHPGLRAEIAVFSTRGDRVTDTPLPLLGGKGAFTAELEAALLEGAIDLAVHSLKDLPTEDPAGLMTGAILPRANALDVLVARSGRALAQLPPGSVVGTSSRRRAAQVLRRHPALRIADIRGNVDTRLRKALDLDGPYDAVIFACAGLERLGLLPEDAEMLSPDAMLPAPGQGALAVQCRLDGRILHLLAPLDHAPTRAAVTAERAFLAGLGGGCATPVAAYGRVEGDRLFVVGRVTAADGSAEVNVSITGPAGDADTLGKTLAAAALSEGADRLLEDVA